MPLTLDGYLPDELGVGDFPRTTGASHTSQLVYLPLGRALPGKGHGTCREAGSHFLPGRYWVRRWDAESDGDVLRKENPMSTVFSQEHVRGSPS